MTIREIGCCGAYCKTCIEYQKKKYPNQTGCLGCKLGYDIAERALNKAKCEIKICCFKEKNYVTCVDCPNYPCKILEKHWSKKGWKYQQTKKQLEFIRNNGYENFIKIADNWNGPHGKLFL